MSDLDIWEQAFKTMNLNENIQFVSRGRLITEASQVEMFNKINALLNADGMECSHKWLYSLDPTELTEAEATKVNNLYKLGCDRGMIECGEAKDDEEANEDEVAVAVEPIPETPAPAPAPTPAVPQTAYTVLYSAMRNGEIKTGEAYSNSINPRSAKADVVGQLERAGYSNVKILAIECGDPDECGNDCCNTYCKQADMTPVAPQVDAIPDYSEDVAVEEPIALEDDKKDDEQVEEADDKSEDAEADKTDDKAADDKEDDKQEDKAADDKEDKKEDKKEDAEEPDEKLKDDAEEKADKASDKDKEDKELDASEKAALKDSYKKAFKAAMLKCKFEDLSFDDLSLEQKVDFFTQLNKQWNKIDPVKFMSDKELDQLESIVVKQ